MTKDSSSRFQAFGEDSALSCNVVYDPIKNIINLFFLHSLGTHCSFLWPRACARKQRRVY